MTTTSDGRDELLDGAIDGDDPDGAIDGDEPDGAIDGDEPDGDELDDDAEVDALLRAVAHVSVHPGAAAPVPRRKPGDRVGDYVLGEELGAGGMGVVHVAEDTRLRRTVALKLLAGGSDGEPDRKRRLLREARAASSVRHPNVATVYEVGEHEGAAFIAMELARGESLRARIRRGALPVAEATRIAAEIGKALAAAHAVGVVHRDLKPDNVHVDEHGGVKVLDFGLAKRIVAEGDAAGPSDQLTVDGRILGTPAYMAPEQIAGRPLDARADVFALGVILFEMLAGRRPFEGDRLVDVLVAVSRDEAPPLRKLRREVPPWLAQLVSRMLAKDPAARPASVDAIVATLERPPAPPRARLALVLGGIVALGLGGAAALRSDDRAPVAGADEARAPVVLDPPGGDGAVVPSVHAAPGATPRQASASAPVVSAPGVAPSAPSVAPPIGTPPTGASPGASGARTPRPPRVAPGPSARPRVDPLADQK